MAVLLAAPAPAAHPAPLRADSTASPAVEPTEPARRLAYVARSDAGSDVFTILPDGSARRRVTFSGGSHPTWAPQGRRLAYADDGDLWTVAVAEPWDPTQVTSGAGVDSDPAWSPDGTRIAFTRGEGIVVLDLVSGSEVSLTTPSDEWPRAFQPAWSPDSSRIAFVQESSDDDDYDNYRRLFVMDSDGTDQHVVANSDSFAHNPSWSPDGITLLYGHRYFGRGYCEDQILSIRADGTRPTRVLKQGCLSEAGTWSPSGSRIAVMMGGPTDDFEENDPKLTGIWSAAFDGSGPHRLIARDAWDPAWQPIAVSKSTADRDQRSSNIVGRRLAFSGTSSAGWDVFTVRPDGRGLRRLTHGGNALSPSWSPDHRRLAYVTDAKVWVMTGRGEHRRAVGSADWEDPSWSPDGRRLVVSNAYGIAVINVGTGEQRRVRVDPYGIQHATWSSNGRWLYFAAASPRFGQREIYRVRPNGSRLERVTRTAGSESDPSLSPSGGSIAYAYSPPGTEQTDVRTMRPGGLPSQVVAESPGMEDSPAFSSTGRHVVFYSEGPDRFGADPRPGLWVAASDGGRHRLILEKREILDVEW